ncbi:hypothetical protein BGZ76_007447 [Entomortierella beljakovae]|nr:hypothetical protein BGZ76_007447 [Entomortierella beljakovae]
MIDYYQVPYCPSYDGFDSHNYHNNNHLSFADGIPSIANSSNPYPPQMQYNQAADLWLQFLHEQYSPKCSQDISPPAPYQRVSEPIEIPHAHPRTRMSLTLSDPCGKNERPRLIPVPAQAMDISQSPNPRAFTRRGSTRSLSISSSCSSSSWCSRSSWSSISSDSSMEEEVEYDSRKKTMSSSYGNKNKVLPPPTLPPILVPAIPEDCAIAAAFYSVKAASCSGLSMGSLIDDDSSVYSFGSESFDSDEESLSEIWSTQSDSDEALNSYKGKYMALTSSIWGPGWHQVEPLPASFIQAMHQSELDAQKKLQIQAQEKAAAQTLANPKFKSKKATKHARASAASVVSVTTDVNVPSARNSPVDGPNSTGWTTGHSARLPRSLQFVD